MKKFCNFIWKYWNFRVQRWNIKNQNLQNDDEFKILNKATGDKIFEATTMQIAVDISSRESFYTAPHKIVNALREANGEKD